MSPPGSGPVVYDNEPMTMVHQVFFSLTRCRVGPEEATNFVEDSLPLDNMVVNSSKSTFVK